MERINYKNLFPIDLLGSFYRLAHEFLNNY